MQGGNAPEYRGVKRNRHAMRGQFGRDIAFHLLQRIRRVARRQVEEGGADAAEQPSRAF